MHVIGSFHYCLHTELAIVKVEQLGIPKDQIYAVPLQLRGETRNIFDTIHHADGVSMFDGGAILGSALMVLGVIYGFDLQWGPIIWGLIGMGAGFLVGFLLDISVSRVKHSRERRTTKDAELFIIVECNKLQSEKVAEALWGHQALGVAIMPGS